MQNKKKTKKTKINTEATNKVLKIGVTVDMRFSYICLYHDYTDLHLVSLLDVKYKNKATSWQTTKIYSGCFTCRIHTSHKYNKTTVIPKKNKIKNK